MKWKLQPTGENNTILCDVASASAHDQWNLSVSEFNFCEILFSVKFCHKSGIYPDRHLPNCWRHDIIWLKIIDVVVIVCYCSQNRPLSKSCTQIVEIILGRRELNGLLSFTQTKLSTWNVARSSAFVVLNRIHVSSSSNNFKVYLYYLNNGNDRKCKLIYSNWCFLEKIRTTGFTHCGLVMPHGIGYVG